MFVVVNLLTVQYIFEKLLLEDSVPPDTSCFNKGGHGQLSACEEVSELHVAGYSLVTHLFKCDLSGVMLYKVPYM